MPYKIVEYMKKWRREHPKRYWNSEKPITRCALCGIGLGVSHYKSGDFKHEYGAETLIVGGRDFIVDEDCRNYLTKYDEDKQYDLLTNKLVCG